MEKEIVKHVVRVGNSAGVILPKEWLNGKAKISLVEKPLNIKKDIFEILEPYLQDVIGIYVIGSYARSEQTERSDVDIFVVTSKINKNIDSGKYEILLVSKDRVENALKKNALPILPMLHEAKAIMNKELVEKFKKEGMLNKTSLKSRIELSKSALAIDREMIKLTKEWPSDCSDAVAYSLVLNLRTVYIINKLKSKRNPSIRGLKSLVEEIAGSLKAYEGYLRVKNNEKNREDLPVEEAEMLYTHIMKKLEEIEKWLKEKKD